MAANVTATKPAPKPKPAGRRPPADTVWVQYHPWIEGLVGHLAAWGLHLAVIGVGLLVVLAYSMGFFKKPAPLPVEPVSIVDAGGGGNPNGTDNPNGGDHAPLAEGVHGDKDNPGTNSDAPPEDRPSLTDDVAKELKEDFTPDDARYINQAPQAAKTFEGLDKDFRDKLRDGVNPSKGNAGPGTGTGTGPGHGPGTGPGTGPGKGKMELNQREKRMLRWSMKFNTRDGNDYLGQLRGLGALLAIPVGPNQYKIIDLSKGPPFQLEDRDLTTIQRIWWIDENPQSIQSLMAAMRLPMQPARVVAFIPPELEDDLAKKELAFKGLREDQIYETKFEVVNLGGRYDVRVFDQTKK